MWIKKDNRAAWGVGTCAIQSTMAPWKRTGHTKKTSKRIRIYKNFDDSLFCFFIKVCTKEEQEILQRDSNKSQKLRKKLMGGETQNFSELLNLWDKDVGWCYALFLFWWQMLEEEIISHTKRPWWRLAWRRLSSTKTNCWNMTRIGIINNTQPRKELHKNG